MKTLAEIHSSEANRGMLKCLELPSEAPPIAPAVDERAMGPNGNTPAARAGLPLRWCEVPS
jgi:hypothetical protein